MQNNVLKVKVLTVKTGQVYHNKLVLELLM